MAAFLVVALSRAAVAWVFAAHIHQLRATLCAIELKVTLITRRMVSVIAPDLGESWDG